MKVKQVKRRKREKKKTQNNSLKIGKVKVNTTKSEPPSFSFFRLAAND